MEYHVLASGSKGNSTFIVEKTTGILIDCGISKKQLVYRLKEIGYTIDDIDYVLLTHDHADHNKNIHIFDKEMVYTAKGNIADLDEDHELVPYTSYTFGDIERTVTLDNIKNNSLYKVAEYTNDFKETDESKKWINIDSFTIESNITEKLHMNIKLNHFDLKINTSSRNNKLDDLTNSYYKEKKQELLNILKDF